MKELAKLASATLFMHGHFMRPETAQKLAHHCAGRTGERARPAGRPRSPSGMIEWLMLAPIWIVTPSSVFVAIADLGRPV